MRWKRLLLLAAAAALAVAAWWFLRPVHANVLFTTVVAGEVVFQLREAQPGLQ